MEAEEYLLLERAAEYDFSNDGASLAYCGLDNISNTLDKFFAYMAVMKHPVNSSKEILKKGAIFSKSCFEKYSPVPDPDSGSKLLQEIYKKLWEEAQLNYCKKENGDIQGDTLNSQNTTLTSLFESFIETKSEKKERMANNSHQNCSILYIMSIYADDMKSTKDRLEQIKGLKRSISLYHTLGNFMPVPVACNGPRGMGKLKDYWDLTLKYIYDYYHFDIGKDDTEKDKVIVNIVGKEDERKERLTWYKKWLDSFKNWNSFVEKNYLQDFVNVNEDDNYGIPKGLWKDHFSGEVKPTQKEQIEQFYEHTASWIIARSTRMLMCLE